MSPVPQRPRRADARRNYELLLAVAREVFEQRGADAPLDEIARRAGIGNATMYRHFPTRRDLIIAVYTDEVTELCARGEALLSHQRPDDALFEWLRDFIAHIAAKRDLALAIDAPRSALFDEWHQAIDSTISGLLTRAQRSGAVSAEVSLADLRALANGIALAGTDPAQIDRLLRLARHGAGPTRDRS